MFKVGQYVISKKGSTYTVGRIKSLIPEGAYVYYDRGVAALTDIDDMHPIANDYCLSNIIVGGEKLEPSI